MLMLLPALIGTPETKVTVVELAKRELVTKGKAVPPFLSKLLLAEMRETAAGN